MDSINPCGSRGRNAWQKPMECSIKEEKDDDDSRPPGLADLTSHIEFPALGESKNFGSRRQKQQTIKNLQLAKGLESTKNPEETKTAETKPTETKPTETRPERKKQCNGDYIPCVRGTRGRGSRGGRGAGANARVLGPPPKPRLSSEKKEETLSAPGKNSRNVTDTGKNASDVPAPGKNAKDVPELGKKVRDASAHGRHTRDLPIPGKNARDVPGPSKNARDKPASVGNEKLVPPPLLRERVFFPRLSGLRAPNKYNGNDLVTRAERINIRSSEPTGTRGVLERKQSTTVSQDQPPPRSSHRYLKKPWVPKPAKEEIHLPEPIPDYSDAQSFPTFLRSFGRGRSQVKKEMTQEEEQKLLKELERDLNSDYDSSDCSESEPSSDDMNVLQLDDFGKTIVPELPSFRAFEYERRPRDKISTEYFEKQGFKVAAPSAKWNEAQCKKHVRKDFKKFMKKIKPAQVEATKVLFKTLKCPFYGWIASTRSGHNILLHGPGNKYLILMELLSTSLQGLKTTNINGDISGMNIKKLLNDIAFDTLKMISVSGYPVEAVAEICRFFLENKFEELFLLVNNIESPAFRMPDIQWTLAELSALPNVHLIATSTHPRPPKLWNPERARKLNFIYKDVSSFILDSAKPIKEGYLALELLHKVYDHLRPSSKNVFHVLMDYQLKEGGYSYYPGMKFSTLYQICQFSNVVHTEKDIRLQITEFLDDDIVYWRRNFDFYSILVDDEALAIFQAEVLA